MTVERTTSENESIDEFLSLYFRDEYEHSEIPTTEEEQIEELVNKTRSYFQRSKGTLGLALDFLMVAEQISHSDGWLSKFDPDRDREDILDRYDRRDTLTLTLKHDGEQYGIRPVQNEVIDTFREDLQRTNFPSSPGHHTGEWERYDDLLEIGFRLTRPSRYEAAQRLFDLGVEELEKKSFVTREPPFSNPLVEILEKYERSDPKEEGGTTYQALAYGYVKTEWPHLSFRASKVRTGSSRQNRHGDIDGYVGPDLMISVEVKDLPIDETNVRSQLGTIIELASETTAISIALCREVSENARRTLEDEDVKVITDADLRDQLEFWDYHKQNRAVQGMIHFLTHIEENPPAVQRLLRFLEETDPNNPALAHLTTEDG